MKTYIKFLLNLFSVSFVKMVMIFFGIIIIINILEEVQFFNEYEAGYFLPLLLSVLNAPSILFEMLPFIFLISTQFFFIKLIDSNELEIFKYKGLTNTKIVKIISILSFFIGIIFILFFYSFSSLLKNEYLIIKNKYVNDGKYLAVINNNGLWLRENFEDKKSIINARKIKGSLLIEVLISEFDKDFNLIQTIESNKIDISSYSWKIFNPKISKNNETINISSMNFYSNYNIEKINTLFSNLSSQSIYGLINLRKNYKSLDLSLTEIDSHFHKIASYPFYLTLITILTSIVMFNIKRQKNSLYRLILGIFLSVTIYYISNFFYALGIGEKIPLFLSIWFPLFILSLINIIFIMKLNEK